MIELQSGPGSLAAALDAYGNAWSAFIAENGLQHFVESAIPTTISWKVADKQTLFENLIRLAPATEQAHIATVNDRFIASIVLRDALHGMWLIKILERRTGSQDPLGLDSIDYLIESPNAAYDALRKASGGVLEKEHNDMHAWLSLRFGDVGTYEAKFVDHIVLHVAQKEMAASERAILAKLGVA